MLHDWIADFSYLGIFSALVIGGLGVPIPEEAVVVAAGALASQDVVQWWLALPVCLAGVLVGDCMLYWAGRRWGDRVLQCGPFRWLVTAERLERLESAYRRRGVLIVMAARHMVGLRSAAMLGAGIVGVPFWRFLVTDVAAAVPGVGLGFGLALFFTNQVGALLTEVHRAERWILAALVLGAATWLLWRRRLARRTL